MRTCRVCLKGVTNGNQVSHSHRLTKRKWKPNLQKLSVSVDGARLRILVCSKCLKKISKSDVVR